MKRTHKKKELSELQALKLENRELKSENRSLKKQLKQLQRKEHSFEETQYEEEEQLPAFDDLKIEMCPECNKGTLKEVYVVGRFWKECDQCDYDTRKLK